MTPNSHPAQKPKHTSKMALVSLLAIFAVLLAACGGGGGGSPAGSSGSSQAPLNVIASSTGTFTAANFNPFINTNAGGLFGSAGLIYEPLVFQNRYTGEIKPWLADTYQLASDAKSISFHIRQGVKWSDGQPFTVKDVTFTLDMLKANPSLDQQGLYSGGVIDSYTTPDANTINITFKKPTSIAPWFFSQTPIVSQHKWSSVSDPVKNTDSSPVGTGPYTLKSFNDSSYVFVKNNSYWQAGLPKVNTVRYLAVNDNTAAQTQIASGQIDWAGIGWDPKFDAQFTQKDPTHNHHWFPGTNTVYLYLNTTRAPFNDARVREAISLGINRTDIQKKAAPYGTPANPTGILVPSSASFLPDAYPQSDTITQDLAKAASLLKDAGFTKGSDGIYAKGGQKLSFKMDVPNGWSDWQDALSVVSDNLKALGVDATPNALATPNLYTQNLQSGAYDAAISWSDQGPSPYFPMNDLLQSTKAHNGSTIATGTNFEHWTDPATDKLLSQYLTSTDQSVQKQAIQGIGNIVATQLPAIPLYYNAGWDEYTTTHFTGWPDANNAYDYGSPFNGEDAAYIILQLKPVQG